MRWLGGLVVGLVVVLGALVIYPRSTAAMFGPGGRLGDLNYDDRVNWGDIEPFVVSLRDPAQWQRRYRLPFGHLLAVADFDVDGRVATPDIPLFGDTLRAGLPGGAGLEDFGDEGEPDLGTVDLDIDSDNTNGTAFPDRSTGEDLIEDDPNYTGKFVLVNADDDDHNGVPDKDQDGAIAQEQDDLVPLILEIRPDTNLVPLPSLRQWRITYPANVRLWKSALRGSFASDVIASGVTQEFEVFWLGDMNGDGILNLFDIDPFVLALTDPNEYNIQYPQMAGKGVKVGDMNEDGVLNFFDIDPFVYALTHPAARRFTPVRVWVEGLAPSSSQADTRFLAEADTDNQTGFDASDAVRATIESLTGSPTAGPLGAQVTWAITPAIAPFAFDANTTARWEGNWRPIVGQPSAPFSIDYSAAQVRESGPAQAVTLVGDGTFTNAPDPENLSGPGKTVGQLQFQLGGLSVRRTFDFAPETTAAKWEQLCYRGGPPERCGAVPTILIDRLSRLPDPYTLPEQTLLAATDFHLAVVIRISENPNSLESAPATILIDLISYDQTGLEADRLRNVLVSKVVPDNDPLNITYCHDLSKPVMFVDVQLNKANYPNLQLLRGVDGGSVAVVPGSN